jgi:hypothetical protein
MMFAVAVMDPTIKMLFYAAAVALFVLAAIGFERGRVSFVAAGLAAFAFPFFWDASPRCRPTWKMRRMPLSGAATRVYGQGDT